MTRGVLASLLVLGMSGLAIGQPSRRGEPAPPEDPALRGPRVTEDDSAEGRGQFVRDARRGTSREAIEFRILQRILGSMASDSADPEVRLSDAQREGLRNVAESHRADVDAYFVSKREEIAGHLRELGLIDLSERLRDDGVGGERIAQAMARAPRELLAISEPGEMMAPEQMESERNRRRELESVLASLTDSQRRALRSLNVLQREAPSQEEARARAMALLTDRQRAHVEQLLDRSRGRFGQGRASEGEMSMLSGLDGPQGVADEARPVRRDRLSRLIAQLSPEQREALADYIEQRLQVRGRDARRGGGEPKPPPSMDDVDVPPPGP